MAAENTFVQPAILKFDGYYDHGSMLMKNFLRSKRVMEFCLRMAFLSQQNPCPCPCHQCFGPPSHENGFGPPYVGPANPCPCHQCFPVNV